MRFGYAKNPLSNVLSARGNIAQFFPIIQSSTSNHVVDCSKRPLRMIQMTVQHPWDYNSLEFLRC